ncbi:MAG: putative cytokinetic ring protein SteA [Acidimicrobiales bacterium]
MALPVEPSPSERRASEPPVVLARGTARVDARTKDLLRRIRPGEIAFIDHEDLDRIAAEGLVAVGVSAVVNAANSATGRYPNVGPLLIVGAGIPLIDSAGPNLLATVDEGSPVTVTSSGVVLEGGAVLAGSQQSSASIEATIDSARRAMGDELERFAENTLSYLQHEAHLLVDDPQLPDVPIEFRGRQVLVVVRGADYRQDLSLLQRTGYLSEMCPLIIGVDGGADALMEIGVRPDVIIGDMDSVSPQTLRCGAALVAHAFSDGHAPGSDLLDELGLDHTVFPSAGTSEDIAMLLAFEKGAELIVLVGSHNSMVDFFDKGRGGMASTFLVRMKVGQILVDARGVSRLYQHRVRKRDLMLLVLAALGCMLLLVAVSEPIRLVVRGYLLDFR